MTGCWRSSPAISKRTLTVVSSFPSSRILTPQPVPPLWQGEKYRHDRIRLAYVSADFREHAVAFQLAPLIERHDRARFQVIGIAIGPSDDSAIRARLVKGFDRFHDLAAL